MCRFRECGCGSACPRDSPAIRTIIVNVCGLACTRTYTNEVGYQSSLKEGIRANNAEQWVFLSLYCAHNIERLLARSRVANSANVFECCRRASFLLGGTPPVPPVSIQTHWKLRLYLFSFSFFLLSPAVPSLLSRARSFALFVTSSFFFFFFRFFTKYAQTDRISALATGEFNLPLRSAMSA